MFCIDPTELNRRPDRLSIDTDWACNYCNFKKSMEDLKSNIEKLTSGGIITEYNQLLNDICGDLQCIFDDLKAEIGNDLEETMAKEPFSWILFSQVT